MQGPGGPDEDTTGGFTAGGWVVPHIDEVFGEIVDGWFARADAFLLGRTTYDLFFPYWSKVADPQDQVATKLNALTKYVASTTLTDPEWQRTTVISGDVAAQVRALKEQPGGELQVHGSAGLIRTLQEAGLVDEYRLLVFPAVAGGGKRLFDAGLPAVGLELTDSRVTTTGVVYTAYTPTAFRAGSVTPDDLPD